MQESSAQASINGNSHESMSSREQEVLKLLLEGDSSKEIASKLHISPRTVDYHRNNIYKKLGVHNYQELVAKYSGVETPASAQTEFTTKFAQSAAELPAQSQTFKISKLHKFLIPAAIFVLFCLVIPLWYFLFKTEPQPLNKKTSAGFIDRTIDTVYLRTEKYDNGIHKFHWYTSLNEIYLSEIFIGDVRNILPPVGSNGFFEIRLSGTVDIELDNVEIHICLIEPDDNYVTLGISGVRRRGKIGPGDFSENFYISINPNEDNTEILNRDDLSDCLVLFKIVNLFQTEWKGRWYFYDGEIPDDIPNGTVMATIRNLKIEPVLF